MAQTSSSTRKAARPFSLLLTGKTANWLLLALLVLAGATYAYLSFSRPLVQLSDIYHWIHRAEKFPDHLDDVFWIDGFYPVGYPIALRLVFGLTNDYLTAAKLLSLAGALAGLYAFNTIARRLLQPALALACTVILALNPSWVEFAAMEGTDMPFVGLALSGLALVLASQNPVSTGRRPDWVYPLLGGLCLGLSYLMRYTGLSLLTFVLVGLVLSNLVSGRLDTRSIGFILIGFLVGSALQTFKAYQLQGNFFYNTQYQNVWFGIYGNGDWGSNWQKAVLIKSFGEVLALSPSKMLANMLANLVTALFSDSSKFFLSILALPGMVLALFDKDRRRWGIVIACGFLGFAATLSLAFVNSRLLLLFLPGSMLFAIYALQRLPQLLPQRYLEGRTVRLGLWASMLFLTMYVFLLVPQLSRPLTDEQDAKLELTRVIRSKGVTDPGKVYSLTFNLHDPYTPTISLYAQPWFMTGVHYPSMSWMAQHARDGGYQVVVTDTQGQWTAPGMAQAWRLDSARILFNEFYSRAGVHGFEVKR